MKAIHVTRLIKAPLPAVFQAVSDVRNFCEAVPHIINIEFLTDQQVGTGTRFRETRVMKGKEQSVELEVAEYVENDRVRMISDAGGTIWDSVFTVKETTDGVSLDLQMDIRPHKFMARLMVPLIRSMVVKGVEDDMESVKQYCESTSR